MNFQSQIIFILNILISTLTPISFTFFVSDLPEAESPTPAAEKEAERKKAAQSQYEKEMAEIKRMLELLMTSHRDKKKETQ